MYNDIIERINIRDALNWWRARLEAAICFPMYSKVSVPAASSDRCMPCSVVLWDKSQVFSSASREKEYHLSRHYPTVITWASSTFAENDRNRGYFTRKSFQLSGQQSWQSQLQSRSFVLSCGFFSHDRLHTVAVHRTLRVGRRRHKVGSDRWLGQSICSNSRLMTYFIPWTTWRVTKASLCLMEN